MKKSILLALTVTGAALLASAAEPVKTEAPTSTNVTSMIASKKPSGGLDAADKAYDAKIGARLAQSGAITTKPKLSATKGFLQSINPMAPMKPVPTTPWISRASWSEVATTEHASSVASASAAETNRELRFKVTVWRD